MGKKTPKNRKEDRKTTHIWAMITNPVRIQNMFVLEYRFLVY